MSSASDTDRQWLLAAIELSRACPPTTTAYCVGAVIVSANGVRLAAGYSRDSDTRVHAEESALARLETGAAADPPLASATIYSSMEPCSARASRPRTCTQLILAAGIRRVVYALREPPLFADGQGDELLRAAGVEVVEVGELAPMVREINAAVLSD